MQRRTVTLIAATALLLPAPVKAAPTEFRYLGMCDASAGIALNATTFAVANDEDNVIRIYPSDRDSLPLDRLEVGRFLGVDQAEKPETDFEGAARLADQVFWITSHGRNKDGEYRPNRHRFFATKVDTNHSTPRLLATGKPYQYLVQDLLWDRRLKPFRLLQASTRPPKSREALNIEGLCSTREGTLLIAFRNPIPKGQALLVPLLNPNELIQGGHAARFGDPILLDLDGRGIRDITRWNATYLIVAGNYDGGGKSRLYVWNGKDAKPTRVKNLDLGGLNPEAIIVYPGSEPQVQFLSDDGTTTVGNSICKELPTPSARSFRSISLLISALLTPHE